MRNKEYHERGSTEEDNMMYQSMEGMKMVTTAAGTKLG
jgi:hypothetical protein